MLSKYEQSVELITTNTNDNGDYDPDTGEWLPGKPSNTKTMFNATILPYSQNEMYQSNGRVTNQSRRMITSLEIEDKSVIVVGNQKYSVEGKTDYKDHSSFIDYNLKWVSVFDNLF